jgi:diguanylate cyclase (GGDEF)-like protein/PAS domain S-box-containing protein
MEKSISTEKYAKPLMWLVSGLGLAALLFTISRINLFELGFGFLLFSLITLGFVSRIIVKIPGVKGQVSVTDTFIFLSILLFNPEAGIILAGADALISSLRFSKLKLVIAFNTAVNLVSTFVTVWTLRFLFGSIATLAQDGFASQFIVAVSVMGLTQYLTNSGLIATGVALRSNYPIWKMWKENFLWTSITYFAGASTAAFVFKSIDIIGIYALLAAAPIVAVVYVTYTTYLKNVEAAAAQTELAQKHVKQLSHHIAEQERISRALKESEEYFRNAFDHAAGMALISPDGSWLQVNNSLCFMLGYTEEELLEKGFQAITHPDDLGNDLANMQKLLKGKIPGYQLEKRYSHKHGNTIWVLQSASLICDADGKPRHVIFQIQDISARKKAEEQIHHAALHDALTGLPNRTLFSDRLSMAVERARRADNYMFAVFFVDLDRFKIVNDSLGHAMGDKLLVDLTRRLENSVRRVDTVARLGGDEFAILLDGISSIADATDVVERIQQSLRQPFDLDGQEFFTTASIGIAYSTLGYDRPEDILRDADTAMYRAKANGKDRCEVFNTGMHKRAVEVLTLESELRRGVERGEVKPFYQPIVFLTNKKIVGFEALARWQHPKRGLVSPADFIPLAEDSGLIIPLGMSILRQACHDLRQWQERFNNDSLTVSVNLSTRQFKQSNLIEEVKTILFESGLRASCLRLEITESAVMENTVTTSEMLSQLKAIGVQLSIDDFGTGYSSLSYLHRIPFDILKIDRSFVSQMSTDRESHAIVKTIVRLASELNRATIAEGIESKEHYDMLSKLSCQYGQGYYFSKPVDFDFATELLRNDYEQKNKFSKYDFLKNKAPETIDNVYTM